MIDSHDLVTVCLFLGGIVSAVHGFVGVAVWRLGTRIERIEVRQEVAEKRIDAMERGAKP